MMERTLSWKINPIQGNIASLVSRELKHSINERNVAYNVKSHVLNQLYYRPQDILEFFVANEVKNKIKDIFIMYSSSQER